MVDLYEPRMYASEEMIKMKKSLINGFLRGGNGDGEGLVIFLVCESDGVLECVR